MNLKVDHVTVAGRQLAPLQAAFAAAGLTTEYGGPHANDVTHMAALSFEDGSYLELISTLEPGAASPLWDAHIAGDGGPCAWAVEAAEVAAEAARVAGLGVPVKGPIYLSRRRSDGLVPEWDQAFLGDTPPGAVLPFVIKDRTPREWRVPPVAPASGSGLRAVARVLLGVKELERRVKLFQYVYAWPAPEYASDASLGAELAWFPDTPVVLAAPVSGGWLADRLFRFGESPCAFLLAAAEFGATAARFGLGASSRWFDQRAAWFDPGRLCGTRLGITGR